MALKEAIQKDGQRHLYVKSAITSGTTQYFIHVNCIQIMPIPFLNRANQLGFCIK